MKSSIDPRDGGQEEHTKPLIRGGLQRFVVPLNSTEGGVPLQNLSTGVTGVPAGTVEAPMLGNGTTNINININGSSNVTININSNDGNAHSDHPPPPEEGAGATAVEPPESPPDTTEILIRTWNIQNSRNTRLETALQELSIVGVDVCFLQETKLTDDIHTRFFSD